MSEVQAVLRTLHFFSGLSCPHPVVLESSGTSNTPGSLVGTCGQLRSEGLQTGKKSKAQKSLLFCQGLPGGESLASGLQSFLLDLWIVIWRQGFAMKPRLTSNLTNLPDDTYQALRLQVCATIPLSGSFWICLRIGKLWPTGPTLPY